MTEAELKKYVQLHFPKENEHCEWKKFSSLKHNFSAHAGEDIVSYVSALANMEGGCLVIGVEDLTLEILGIKDFNGFTTSSIKFKIIEKCSNLNSEELRTEEFTSTDTHKTIWVIHIPKHNARLMVYAHGKAWQRIGDSLVELTKDRRDSILKEPLAMKEDWSAQIIPHASIDDLDAMALLKAREEFKEKNPRKAAECDAWDEPTFLNKAKLTIKGQITNTAILLLGKEESTHFIQPAIAKISWILKDSHNAELDYEHFSVPFLLNSSQVFDKIRNLTYRYMKDDTLFPTEIKMYDTYVIREAFHNCIAHQDYALQGRISVVEKPDELIFSNAGDFIPKTVESVIDQDAPQEYYRNAFLAEAMVHLNMIDTIGSGIKRMFIKQRERFFPLPDFDVSNPEKVVVKIAGRIWDENYTKLLMSKTDLDLKTVVLLDRVQKGLSIDENEIALLKKQGLIEGRKPNFYISASVASATGDKSSYIKLRGLKDDHYKKMILEYLDQYKSAAKIDIEKLILDLLPNVLNKTQKENKLRNLMHSMSKKDKTIHNGGTNRNPKWMRTPPPF